MPTYEMFDPEAEEKKVGKGGAWLTFGDGDVATVTFVGKTYRREQVWISGHGETFDPNNPAHVQWLNTPDKEGRPNRVQVRIAGNVVMKLEDGHEPPYEVRILELAPTHWRRIIKRVKKFGVAKWYLVERSGSSAQDTDYEVDPAGDLSAEEKAAFGTLEFFDLEKFYASKGKPNGGDDSFNYGANAE